MKLLVVEDEAGIASFVERGLRQEGFEVVVAADGPGGLALALDPEVDLVVLDLMLPGLAGDEVLRRIRASGSDVPVILLTARDGVRDRVAGLDAGADDYLTKPFNLAELVARVRARLRVRDQGAGDHLEVADVRLDMRARVAHLDGRQVELTTREFDLLELFMRHPGQVFSQAHLVDRVWGMGHDGASNVVEVYVGYLRRKLRRSVIETVRGSGYRFVGR
ncbi:MAG: response regulator transcription factor [Nitriliruptoraceae bacterium]